MNYPFECSCGHKEIISMPIKEYSADNHFCPICNKEMYRPVESLVCGYTNNKDFFGKTGQHN